VRTTEHDNGGGYDPQTKASPEGRDRASGWCGRLFFEHQPLRDTDEYYFAVTHRDTDRQPVTYRDTDRQPVTYR
jgi:hypothetical protein